MANEQRCMHCGKPATHKITKIIKGKVRNLFLCDEHAREVSPYLQITKPDQSKLVELLQHFLKQQESMEEAAAKTPEDIEANPICPNCGLTFGAYRKTLLLGCSDCYASFETMLLDDLRKIHGAVSQHPEQPEPTPKVLEIADEETDEAMLANQFASEAAAAVEPEPEAEPEPSPSVEDLRRALQEAIEREEFQEAARLRDAIREMQTKQENSEEPEA